MKVCDREMLSDRELGAVLGMSRQYAQRLTAQAVAKFKKKWERGTEAVA